MFSNAKPGAYVWSVLRGWGTVVSVNHMLTYGLKVKFLEGLGGTVSYDMNGKCDNRDMFPELYWDKISVTVPPCPEKQRVRHSLIGFCNIYKGTGTGAGILIPHRDQHTGRFFFKEKEDAIEKACGLDDYLTTAKITVEYDTEE